MSESLYGSCLANSGWLRITRGGVWLDSRESSSPQMTSFPSASVSPARRRFSFCRPPAPPKVPSQPSSPSLPRSRRTLGGPGGVPWRPDLGPTQADHHQEQPGSVPHPRESQTSSVIFNLCEEYRTCPVTRC